MQKTFKTFILFSVMLTVGIARLHAQASISAPTDAAANLKKGGQLKSQNKMYMATFQADGNLCVYKMDGGNKTFVWGTGTDGKKASECRLQSDGRLLILASGKTLWSSMPKSMPKVGYQMTMQDDGNLCIYTATNHQFVWSSKK